MAGEKTHTKEGTSELCNFLRHALREKKYQNLEYVDPREGIFSFQRVRDSRNTKATSAVYLGYDKWMKRPPTENEPVNDTKNRFHAALKKSKNYLELIEVNKKDKIYYYKFKDNEQGEVAVDAEKQLNTSKSGQSDKFGKKRLLNTEPEKPSKKTCCTSTMQSNLVMSSTGTGIILDSNGFQVHIPNGVGESPLVEIPHVNITNINFPAYVLSQPQRTFKDATAGGNISDGNSNREDGPSATSSEVLPPSTGSGGSTTPGLWTPTTPLPQGWEYMNQQQNIPITPRPSSSHSESSGQEQISQPPMTAAQDYMQRPSDLNTLNTEVVPGMENALKNHPNIEQGTSFPQITDLPEYSPICNPPTPGRTMYGLQGNTLNTGCSTQVSETETGYPDSMQGPSNENNLRKQGNQDFLRDQFSDSSYNPQTEEKQLGLDLTCLCDEVWSKKFSYDATM